MNKNKPRFVSHVPRNQVIKWHLEESSRQSIGHVWIYFTLVRKRYFFNKIMSDSLNLIMPVKTRTVHNNDALGYPINSNVQ